MVTEAILSVLFGIVEGLFYLMPDFSFSIPVGVYGAAADFLNMVGYLLPVGTINAVLAVIIDIAVLRITIAGIRAIWKFIPFLGG